MNYRIVERKVFQVVGVKRECPCGNEAEGPGIPEFWGEVNENGTANRLVQLMNGEIKGLLELPTIFLLRKHDRLLDCYRTCWRGSRWFSEYSTSRFQMGRF